MITIEITARLTFHPNLKYEMLENYFNCITDLSTKDNHSRKGQCILIHHRWSSIHYYHRSHLFMLH